MDQKTNRVAVVGAGPAGLMAAIAASGGGAEVTVYDRMPSPGKKLLASGGGRCNLTNLASGEQFEAAFGRKGRFIRSALQQFDASALRKFFADNNVKTMAVDSFHVFPSSNRAADVLSALLGVCKKLNVKIVTDTTAEALITDSGKVNGLLLTGTEEPYDKVIVAAGGASYPTLGSDGSGFSLAAQTGHRIVAPVPALVGLVTNESWIHANTGIALDNVEIWLDEDRKKKQVFRGSLLFTHRGISGPAVLNMSGLIARLLLEKQTVSLRIALTPHIDREAWLAKLESWRKEQGSLPLAGLLKPFLPQALMARVCEQAGNAGAIRAGELSRETRDRLIEMFLAAPVTVRTTEGFAHAMVTSGGVDLNDVNSATMESRRISGLYFAGEILDLDGPCGGYNLQWAFSSGYLAGLSAEGSPERLNS